MALPYLQELIETWISSIAVEGDWPDFFTGINRYVKGLLRLLENMHFRFFITSIAAYLDGANLGNEMNLRSWLRAHNNGKVIKKKNRI